MPFKCQIGCQTAKVQGAKAHREGVEKANVKRLLRSMLIAPLAIQFICLRIGVCAGCCVTNMGGRGGVGWHAHCTAAIATGSYRTCRSLTRCWTSLATTALVSTRQSLAACVCGVHEASLQRDFAIRMYVVNVVITCVRAKVPAVLANQDDLFACLPYGRVWQAACACSCQQL